MMKYPGKTRRESTPPSWWRKAKYERVKFCLAVRSNSVGSFWSFDAEGGSFYCAFYVP